MNLLLLRIYQRQIVHQCRAALFAAENLNEQQKLIEAGKNEEFNHEVLWCSIQNLLTASANISKTLWSQGARKSVEREPLRESLNIQDESVLANTDLRNHLDHYDERIDRWFRDSVDHVYIDYSIGSVNSSIGGVDETNIFRHYDPETGHVVFWGEHYSIPELIAEIHPLLEQAEREACKPHWEN